MTISLPVIVVTGAEGFIGQNLVCQLGDKKRFSVRPIVRSSTAAEFVSALQDASVVFHLAGVNRPEREDDFKIGNQGFTAELVNQLEGLKSKPRIIFSSSTKASEISPYGESKRAAEDKLLAFAARSGAEVLIYRLPNVFGKWSKPNYNSAVATFCYNVARGLDIKIFDAAAKIDLLYIDDLIAQWLAMIDAPVNETGFVEPLQVYHTDVGVVAKTIQGFANKREANFVDEVGKGLTRALYATFVSALPVEKFVYDLVSHVDPRGAFSEVIKTENCGQFSYFTAHPGVTRGGHYHHSKTEKFLIVEGQARFRFRHVLTGERLEIVTHSDRPQIVETIPGWAHDLTNIGSTKLVALLWANEIFDHKLRDTIIAEV